MRLINMSNTVQTVAQKTLEYLREHGWCQGIFEDSNGNCWLIGAARKVTGYFDQSATPDEYFQFWKEIKRRAHRDPTEWNDSPNKTFADVEKLLTTIASGADE